jgi:hypothetical protein
VLYLERQAEGEGREEDRVDDYCNQSVLQQTNDSIVNMRRDAMLCYAMHCYAHCE